MRKDYIIQTIIATLIVGFVLFFVSCKSQDCIPETIYRDSIRTEYKLDSVFVFKHDSVFRDRWRSNDTIYVTVEKWRTRYKDKIIIQRDTIRLDNDVVKVQQVKYIPPFVKWLAWAGGILLVLIFGWIVLKVYRKFFLKI